MIVERIAPVALTAFIIGSALTASVAISPVAAEWRVESFRDRMNDRDVKYATVMAKAEDQGISAKIEMTCGQAEAIRLTPLHVETYRTKRRDFALVLSRPFTRGQIGVVYRVDESEQRPVFMNVFSDPHKIPFISAPPFDLAGAKRFRIQLQPSGGQRLFYDFDLTGLAKAIADIGCR